MFGCTHTIKQNDAQTRCVQQSKYMDMEQLVELCNSDTNHYKSLMFVSPYCYGCIQRFKDYVVPAIEEMDTTSWKFYYLIDVDDDDTLDYNFLMARCHDMGVDTNNAYIWKHDTYKETYNRLLSLFKSTHSIENTMSGVPRNILLDKDNYIATEKVYDYDNRDSFWYQSREIYDGIHTMKNIDFSIDDTSRHIMVRNVQ